MKYHSRKCFKLVGRLDEATRNTERILKFEREKPKPVTYAQPQQTIRNLGGPVEPTYSMIVSGKPPSEMKDIIRQQSRDQKIRVDGMRERRDGSLTVKCPSIQERNKLVASRELEASGIQAIKNPKLGPRVIIYDVPNKLNADGILADIHEYTTNSIMTLDELKKSTRTVSRPVKKDTEMGNLIIECTPRVYTKILAARKVYLEYWYYNVRESNNVQTCFKCLAFGHQLRDCKAVDRVCRNCGLEGHCFKECVSVTNCRMCKLKGLVSDHRMLTVACPVYLRAVESVNARY